MNTCLTCDRSDAWHRRAAESALEHSGPDGEREFEYEHPVDEDERLSGDETRWAFD